MKRIQVQLTDAQERRLRKRASASGKSIAGTIRDAVDKYVDEDDREARIRRALGAMSGFRDRRGATDVGVNHDRYLTEVYEEQIRRGRRR
jgi:hypothetical protein